MNSENNNCCFILKNYNLCKNKATKELHKLNYCTRHYNKLFYQIDDKLKTKDINNLNKISEFLLEIKELKKYKNLEYINSGSFLDVYKLELDNKIYALKYQDITSEKNVLYYEYLLLQTFHNSNNIIKINVKPYFTKSKKYSLLLVEYLDTNFYDYTKNLKNITDDDKLIKIQKIKNIGIQLINAIKYIHSKRYLYIDLKPDNIMFKEDILKLIDFNLCIKYIDSYSKYYPNNKLKSRQGNDWYSSRNINLGFRGVRIDDIESILYILLDLLDINEFSLLKQSKQINMIIDKKKYIFTNKYEYEFINQFIMEINKYISNDKLNNKLENKVINYNNFINILLSHGA